MADNKYVFEFTVTGDGEVKMKTIADSVKRFGEEAEDAAKKSTGAFGNFVSTLAALGVWDAFKEGAKRVWEFGKESIHAAEEQEKANIRLAESLVATGKYTEKTAESLKGWADEMQYATGVQDELIINSQATIESLAALDEKGLKRATKAALDLSKGMGIDLTRASEMVGRAALGNTEIFRRSGIMIAETGNVAKDFETTLKTLEARFGGRAAAEAETFGGTMNRMKITFGELQEAIGFTIMNNQSLINVMNVAAKAFADLGKYLTQNKVEMGALVSDGIFYVVKGFALAIDIIQGVQKVILYASMGFAKFTELAVRGASTMSLGLIKTNDTIETTQALIKGFADDIQDIDAGASALGRVSNVLEAMGKAAQDGYGKTTEAAKAAEYAHRNNHAAVVRLTDVQQKLIEQGKQLIEQANFKADPMKEFEKKKAAIDAYAAYEPAKRAEALTAIAELEKEAKDKSTDLRMQKAAEYLAENDALIAQDAYANQTLIEMNRMKAQAIINTEDNKNKTLLELQKKTIDQQKQLDEKRKTDQIATINYIATLQTAKTKELQIIGKAAAISTATIDGVIAVQKALAAFPPPFNFVMAGLVGVAAAANIAKISGVELATGITEVPAGYPNDSFPARLTSGERVVDAGTNQDLKGFLSGTSGMSALLARIADRIDRLENHILVQIGDKVIVDVLRESLRQGRALNV